MAHVALVRIDGVTALLEAQPAREFQHAGRPIVGSAPVGLEGPPSVSIQPAARGYQAEITSCAVPIATWASSAKKSAMTARMITTAMIRTKSRAALRMRVAPGQVARRQGWPKRASAATGCLRRRTGHDYARPMRSFVVNNAGNNNNRPPSRVDD